MDMQRRLRTMGYSAELLDNDFMASPEDLVRPDVQISPVRTISDFELATLRTKLEVWAPSNTTSLVLSLLVQKDGEADELEKFKDELVRNGISKQRSILATHRLGVSGFLSEGEERSAFFSKIRVFQALIDLKPGTSAPLAADPSCEQVFQQSCSLSELAIESQGSNLLASPTYLAQALVSTRTQSSKFIDMPSGLLTVVLKKLSHTSTNFQAANY